MVTHAFILSTFEAEEGKTFEFKASLLHWDSSTTARATQQCLLKTQNINNNDNNNALIK